MNFHYCFGMRTTYSHSIGFLFQLECMFFLDLLQKHSTLEINDFTTHKHTYIIHERCLTENQFTRGAIFCFFIAISATDLF